MLSCAFAALFTIGKVWKQCRSGQRKRDGRRQRTIVSLLQQRGFYCSIARTDLEAHKQTLLRQTNNSAAGFCLSEGTKAINLEHAVDRWLFPGAKVKRPGEDVSGF